MVSRRVVLVSGGTVLGLGALAAYGVPRWLARSESADADRLIPDAPAGDERLERLRSSALGRDTDLYLAVPDGHGDGRGLPVCIVLHGASATAVDYQDFGLGRFLTDAARRGGAPFVLAGVTGPSDGWTSAAALRLLRDELPGWCAERGFDVGRLAAWGWSRGGFGALRLAQEFPESLRATAAFSPAVREGDQVFRGVDELRGTPVGLWCGRSDGYFDDVRALRDKLTEPAAAGSWGDGGHTRTYWNSITPQAFDFIGSRLADRR